jgi:hypothetical protein
VMWSDRQVCLKNGLLIVAAVMTLLLAVSPLFAQKTPANKADTRTSQEKGRTDRKRAVEKSSTVSARKSATSRNKSHSDKFRGGAGKTEAAGSGDREKIALAFAKQHHPELVGLLEHLKDEKRPQYARAIRDLSAARERLHKIQQRLPERYERDLQNWKLDSRIRLMLARLQMADPSEVDSLQDELRNLVTKRMDSRLAQLQEEKTRLQARIRILDKSINELSSDRTESVDRELRRLERTLTKSRPAKKNTRPSVTSRKKKKSDSEANAKSEAKSTRRTRPPNRKKTQDNQ